MTQWPFGTVGAGERGVMLRFNAVTGKVLDEGLYFRLPFVERVIVMDTKVEKEQVDASAASSDLQTVNSKVAVNYHLRPEAVASIYQSVGVNYRERLLDPALQESVKASTAKYTAEELVTKREMVRDEIKTHLTTKLTAYGIVVDDFNIVNFDFSKSFNEAIEAKVTAEQNAIAAKNKLEQVKYEKEQRITSAQGEAEAIRIQAQAITQQGGKEYVNLKWVEKWNGQLPTTSLGSAVPLVSITQ